MNAETRKKKILVADDTLFFRSMLEDLLLGAGFEVATASDGEEALKKIEGESPGFDLVILDLLMPKKSGFDVIREVRKDPGDVVTPILVITEYYTEESEIKKIREIGASGYLTKSSRPDEIMFRVKNILYPAKEDLRRHVRIPCEFPVTFEAENAAYQGRSYSLSSGGIFIITTDLPRVKTLIKLRFWLPSTERVVQCTGQVVWRKEHLPDSIFTHPPGIGVAFLDMKEEDRATVCEYISSQISETTRET
jgi:uncharacterized protein (TIGR02266 family)